MDFPVIKELWYYMDSSLPPLSASRRSALLCHQLAVRGADQHETGAEIAVSVAHLFTWGSYLPNSERDFCWMN